MDDLIWRQDAIEVLATMQGQCTSKVALIQNSKIWQQIKDLPPAQPKVLTYGEGELKEKANVIEKIRAEIEHVIDYTHDSTDYDTSLYNGAYKDGLYKVLDIIDKYSAESEDGAE